MAGRFHRIEYGFDIFAADFPAHGWGIDRSFNEQAEESETASALPGERIGGVDFLHQVQSGPGDFRL